MAFPPLRVAPPLQRPRFRLKRLKSLLGLCVAGALSIAGCSHGPAASTGSRSGVPRASRSGIDSLHLFGLPVALDLDGLPGADGFGITVYASEGDTAKGVAVKSGQLEVLMFDGVPGAEMDPAGPPPAPLRTWMLGPAELKQVQVKTSLGIGYRLTPAWQTARPRMGTITVLVRYLPARGLPLASAPITIAIGPK